jgi:HD superfamily phosphohydrolase
VFNAKQPAAADARIEEFLSQLRKVYIEREKPLEQEFNQEKDATFQILRQLGLKLPPAGFDLMKPIGVGSTATVWVVHHRELDQDRALKVPRPNPQLKNTTKILIDERQRLAAVNHQNIIRIYGSGEVDCQISGQKLALPYFIMEYLPEFSDFDKAILSGHTVFTDAALIAHFRDALTGISVLHSAGIVHCDIKPGNLLIAPGKPTVVTDLGYAKVIKLVDTTLTDIRFTARYAHPDLIALATDKSNPDANLAPIRRSDLRTAFDLYAFGKTMQDVLHRFRQSEEKEMDSNPDRKPVLTPYQWTYLSIISKRLLDGKVYRREGDWLLNDIIPGLGEKAMEELHYSSAAEALIDFEKLLHLHDLESSIPELTGEIRNYIQIPFCHVPLTNRVRETIAHPAMSRLGQVSQLGFVSSSYPGARHTRLEHTCGTFAHCCAYLRALWYDQDNCLFQCIMSEKDIKSLLVAALIHDVAQYPMAHDLSEVASDFSHEEFTESILHHLYPGCQHSLAHIVESEWDLHIEQILRIINTNMDSTLKERILHSIIDGPIDCDKLDYLKRDSVHLGVNFGLGIDDERLVRYLTVVYDSKSEKQEDQEIKEILDFAEIGVHEKALTVAASIGQARMDMFTQVYWQHTTRCMKAMLSYAVRKIILSRTSVETEEFWSTFQGHVFDPMFYRFTARDRILSDHLMTKIETEQHEESLENDFSSVTQHEVSGLNVVFPDLGPTDDAMLLFLLQFAKEPPEREILNLLRSRRLYRRIAVLTGEDSREAYRQKEKGEVRKHELDLHENIYDQFRINRLDGDLGKIEGTREKWESNLIKKIKDKLPNSAPASIRQMADRLDTIKPLILVDVPVKRTKRSAGATDGLRYLTEDSLGVHLGQHKAPVPKFEVTRIILDDEAFDKRVGKIRVFAHPEYRDLIIGSLTRAEILSALKP